ncbi:MAG TPA: molybdenum cofactor synthesis domain-containing protein [Phycisphaerae bacterium]|nr:molybdenum cofactor synthesis domain-containing protein [Phycisphaerae bacterium]
MATVDALCISEKTGEQKRPVDAAEFRKNHGIVGDAHAGPWHRQVSLLATDDVESARRKLPDIGPGDFAENVVISGLDLGGLGLGTRLRLGRDVVLRITQIGKDCHTPCRIGRLTGDCIMPRLGLFVRVETGGRVRPGDAVEVLEIVPRERFQAVVLTVSDRCSRGEATDTAGPAANGLLTGQLGAHVYAAEVLPDEKDAIAERLGHYCDGHSIDLVVTVGGTGLAPRDVTPEATRRVVERLTPGLDEAMRSASLRKTPHAMLSRGVCGIRGRTLIVNLPGSERAAVENLRAILPALEHGLTKLRGDPSDCGRATQADRTTPD